MPKRLKIKFRIADLLAITAIFAILIVIYQRDLLYFRQLMFLGMVALTSTIAVLAYSTPQKRSRTAGMIGGFLGGLFYLNLVYLLVDYLFEPSIYSLNLTNAKQYQSMVNLDLNFSFWALDSLVVLAISVPLGCVLGPMIGLYLRVPKQLTQHFRTIFLAVIQLIAVILMGAFSMLDRVSYSQTRDWTLLIVVGLLAFVIYSYNAIGRIEQSLSADRRQATDREEDASD